MIRDEGDLRRTPRHGHALDCLRAGIEAAHPAAVVEQSVGLRGDDLHCVPRSYSLRGTENVVVLGAGNAAGHVAVALERALGDRIDRGAVVTDDPVDAERVEVLEGTHPLPSERNVAATRRVRDLATECGEDDLVLAVVGGGGSALLCAPAGDVALDDVRVVTDALLRSGADIAEINAVRKHLSAVKGGQLARAVHPATTVGLVFSDVVGNDLSVVASGPTAPDPTTYADALAVLDRYGVDAPGTVRAHLDAGARGDRPETPGADDPVFERVHNHVLADGNTALRAAAAAAEERGYRTLTLSSRVTGEAREAAKTHVAVAAECRATGTPLRPPAAVLAGGETTVTVRGDGSGGPNQEFALSAALGLDAGVVVASIDTDGRDGGTDAAGAIVDADTVDDPEAARDALADNDAYTYLDGRDALVRTGPTGTNVNDLRVVLVGDPGRAEQ